MHNTYDWSYEENLRVVDLAWLKRCGLDTFVYLKLPYWP